MLSTCCGCTFLPVEGRIMETLVQQKGVFLVCMEYHCALYIILSGVDQCVLY